MALFLPFTPLSKRGEPLDCLRFPIAQKMRGGRRASSSGNPLTSTLAGPREIIISSLFFPGAATLVNKAAHLNALIMRHSQLGATPTLFFGGWGGRKKATHSKHRSSPTGEYKVRREAVG